MVVIILSTLFILGCLVIVHELGHLLAAKKLGIRVDSFSIGMGPRIFGFKKGGTDYRISLIPIGGFVRMAGDPATDGFNKDSQYFSERPPLHKIIVLSAGPLMNILFAMILLSCIHVVGASEPAFLNNPAVLGWIKPESIAQDAGLRMGDRVMMVNDEPVSSWKDLSSTLFLYNNRTITVKVKRGTKIVNIELPTSGEEDFGFYPEEQVRINAVVANSPAEIAGLQSGDEISALNDQPINSWNQLLYLLSKSDSKKFEFDIKRIGSVSTFEVMAETDPKTNKKYVGISYSPEEVTVKYSIPVAIKTSIIKVKENIVLTLNVLWKLITRDISLDALGGPVMIAKASGDVARIGAVSLFSFMAFLSIQLGFVNLLPFLPIVDGGQIAFCVLESIRKRPLKIATLEWSARIGWAVMIILIILITRNDIIRLL